PPAVPRARAGHESPRQSFRQSASHSPGRTMPAFWRPESTSAEQHFPQLHRHSPQRHPKEDDRRRDDNRLGMTVVPRKAEQALEFDPPSRPVALILFESRILVRALPPAVGLWLLDLVSRHLLILRMLIKELLMHRIGRLLTEVSSYCGSDSGTNECACRPEQRACDRSGASSTEGPAAKGAGRLDERFAG